MQEIMREILLLLCGMAVRLQIILHSWYSKRKMEVFVISGILGASWSVPLQAGLSQVRKCC